MRAVRLLLVAIVVVLGACGDDAGAGEAPQQPPATATDEGAVPGTEPPASAPPATGPVEVPPPDLAVYIAAVNEALEETSYQDAALSDPEVFIGVGQLFCELLTEGETVDSVLGEYLDALADGETGVAADDDVLAAGVIMGASIEVLCPEYGDVPT